MDYNTIWMSDLHLGTRRCQAERLLDFLRHNEFQTLYLVGDIIDFWNLKRDHYWPQSHNDVIQKILRKARKGTNVVLVPGNHDEFCGNFLGTYGNVSIKRQDICTTLSGQRLLVMHGHEFDTVIQNATWLAWLGDMGYDMLLYANRPLNALRRLIGMEYWSLSAAVKSRVKRAVNFISSFEDCVVRYAHMHRVEGIVCGHIHTPAIKRIRDIAYYNCGDWVESHTALAERFDGKIELLRWKPAEHIEVQTLRRSSLEDVPPPDREMDVTLNLTAAR